MMMDGTVAHCGPCRTRQVNAVNTAQQIIKENETNAESCKDFLNENSDKIRHLARAPVNRPNPNVCASAIEMVPANRA